MKLASWPLTVAGAFVMAGALFAQAEPPTLVPPPFPPKETPEQSEYLLRLNEDVGNRFNYQVLIRTEVKPDDDSQIDDTAVFSIQATVTAEVVEVAPDGITYLYRVEVENVEASGQFEPFAGPIADNLSGERTVKLDPRGRRLGDDAGSTGLLGATFPDDPIRIGESWTSTTFVDGEPVETIATFQTVESVFGNEALRIEVTPARAVPDGEEMPLPEPDEEPAAEEPEPQTVTLWIDPETGRTLRASLNQSVPGTIGTTSTMVRQEINPDIALPPVESEYAVVFEPVEERWLYNVSYRFFDPASGERLGVVPGRIEVTDLGDGFALETTLEDAGQFGPWIEQLLPERESVVAAGQTSSEPPILIPFPQEAVSIGSRWNAGVLGEAWLIGIDTFRGEFGLLVETISVDGSETATLLIDPATGVVLRAKYEGTVSEGDNRYPYEFRMERQPGSGSR